MIQANELRIGNYIYKLGNVIQVENETFRNVDAMLFPYEPIPITEEWLLKFGFKKDRNNEFWLTVAVTWVYIKFTENLEPFVYYRDNGVPLYNKVNYVHQFQNLYFALKQTELEINE